MGITLLAGYFAFAIAASVHAMHDAIVHRAGRDRYMDSSDVIVLGIVALVAGVLWIVFVPIYLAGWLADSLARRQRVGRAVAPSRIPPLTPGVPDSDRLTSSRTVFGSSGGASISST